MAASAGYGAVIKMNGASVTLTGEACSYLSGADPAKVYQVTAAAKQLLNPSVTIVVKDGGATVPAANYVIDYLFGKIRFVGYTVLGAITLDGAYLVMWTITTAKAYNVDDGYIELEATHFNAAGDKFRILGVRDAPGTVSRLDIGRDDYSGGSTVTIQAALACGDVLLEITPVVGGRVFRQWCKFSKDSIKDDVGGLSEAVLSFTTATRGTGAALGWSDE